MRFEDIFNLLGFNQNWVNLGILTQEKAKELMSDYLTSDDKNAEHYRWRVFKDFMDENSFLEKDRIHEIYDLCKTEPDDMLQDSMIHTLIRRSDFPNDLLLKESRSEVKSIAKIALKKIEERNQNK